MADDELSDDQARRLKLLWGTKREASRGPKPGLSTTQIARAAIAIADAEGVEAISMQRVARECGVTTMALYRYVKSKAELIALMIEVVSGDAPDLSSIHGGWRPQLEAWAWALWRLFTMHPASLEITEPIRVLGPNELGWLEAAVGALTTTGLPAEDAVGVALVILGHIREVARTAQGARQEHEKSGQSWELMLGPVLQAHRERFPALNAAVASGRFSEQAGHGFELGLRLLLDGVATSLTERGLS